ncbi:MAG TPA: hypothetical protein DCW31_01090, partial [Lactobacillus sp.]|nr:hypothetical protein [Lactobacillus sp.]
HEANIDRKTFYAHFSSVASVLMSIEQDIIHTMMSGLPQNHFDLTKLIIAMNQNMHTYRAFFLHMAQTHDHAFFIAHSENNITAVLQKTIPQSPTVSNYERYIRIRLVSSGIVRVYLDWLSDPHNTSMEQMTNILNQIITPILRPLMTSNDT